MSSTPSTGSGLENAGRITLAQKINQSDYILLIPLPDSDPLDNS
jgi:hypothetical protein